MKKVSEGVLAFLFVNVSEITLPPLIWSILSLVPKSILVLVNVFLSSGFSISKSNPLEILVSISFVGFVGGFGIVNLFTVVPPSFGNLMMPLPKDILVSSYPVLLIPYVSGNLDTGKR